MLTGPSGGYLWGFIPAVYIIGLIAEKRGRPAIFINTVTMLGGLAVVYICGALQLSLIMGYNTNQAIIVGVLPYLPLDLLKAFLAAYLALQLKRKLQRQGLDHNLLP